MSDNHDDEDDKKDLTRIEDLSEFLHEESEDLDDQFSTFANHEEKTNSSILDISSLEDSNELPPEIPHNENDILDEAEEVIEDASLNDYFTNTSELNSEILSETNYETEFVEEDTPSIFDDPNEDNNEIDSNDFFTESETQNEADIEAATVDENETTSSLIPTPYFQEKFEEVRNFAQNFSYGTVDGAGNPPFSIIIKNIKFSEDAESIIMLLKEFNIVNDDNEKENLAAISMGSFLIPQISEFSAILISHKLRRFDLDLEVGLSDDIHSSKSGDINPRGLTKKNSIHQNRKEEIKLSKMPTKLEDLLLTTANQINGYEITKFLGIEHAHSVIEADEVKRLNFVYKGLRDKNLTIEDEKIFSNYKNEFQLIYDELLDEIKNKAYKEGANALLGINFAMNLITDNNKNLYQISCSCTKAIINQV